MDVAFLRDDKCQQAFKTLKERLSSNPVLCLFNPELPVKIHMGTCRYGISTVLAQSDGGYVFRPSIFGMPVTIITDQASLTWLMTIRNLNGHPIRWSLLIQQFDITLKHRPGRRKANADCSSRLLHEPVPPNEEEIPLLVANATEGADRPYRIRIRPL
ncbi:uncharacterized protein LOC135379380 [Ornithodoros turicata]|uniref:uncharacterized protein LOC135379380 n=1 Tax=Ornithodoros turicata TaxID=34597 RepID=UPI003138E432